MLEKPAIQDEIILGCLRQNYGLNGAQVTFLPLGADRHTAVYRAITDDGNAYFVKLRSGDFDAMSIIVPKLLHDQGNHRVIAPLSTGSQTLWANLGDFKLTLFPFVEGRNGYDIDLTDQHWIDLGRALRTVHTAAIPPDFADRIQQETYSDTWRETVKAFQKQAETTTFRDPIAATLATFLNHERDTIGKLVARAEYLAAIMRTQPTRFVLCHADIHAANILIDANDDLYVVDWDTLMMAPKERDLMYVGGSQFANQRLPDEEEHLFYQGYGHTQVDPVGLAYYRYERIVEDIAVYCEEILLTQGDGEDRTNGLRQLTDQFQPNNVVEIAFLSEKTLPPQHRAE